MSQEDIRPSEIQVIKPKEKKRQRYNRPETPDRRIEDITENNFESSSRHQVLDNKVGSRPGKIDVVRAPVPVPTPRNEAKKFPQPGGNPRANAEPEENIVVLKNIQSFEKIADKNVLLLLEKDLNEGINLHSPRDVEADNGNQLFLGQVDAEDIVPQGLSSVFQDPLSVFYDQDPYNSEILESYRKKEESDVEDEEVEEIKGHKKVAHKEEADEEADEEIEAEERKGNMRVVFKEEADEEPDEEADEEEPDVEKTPKQQLKVSIPEAVTSVEKWFEQQSEAERDKRTPICFIAKNIDSKKEKPKQLVAKQFVNLYRAVGAGMRIALLDGSDLHVAYNAAKEELEEGVDDEEIVDENPSYSIALKEEFTRLISILEFKRKPATPNADLLNCWKSEVKEVEEIKEAKTPRVSRSAPEDFNSPVFSMRSILVPEESPPKVSAYTQKFKEAFAEMLDGAVNDLDDEKINQAIRTLSEEEKIQLHARTLYLQYSQNELSKANFLAALSDVVNYGIISKNEEKNKEFFLRLKTEKQLNALLLNLELRELNVSPECQDAFWEGMGIAHLAKKNATRKSSLSKEYEVFFSTPNQFYKDKDDVNDLKFSTNEDAYDPNKFLLGYQALPVNEDVQYRRRQWRVLAKREAAVDEYSKYGIHEALLDPWILETFKEKLIETDIDHEIKTSKLKYWFLLFVAGTFLALCVFSITLLPIYLAAIEATWILELLEVITPIVTLIIFGLSIFIAQAIREKLRPNPETNLEATCARVPDVEEAIYLFEKPLTFSEMLCLDKENRPKLKHPSQLTLEEKERLLDFLHHMIALLKNEKRQLSKIDVDKYPQRSWLNSLRVMAIVLELERDANKNLKCKKHGVTEKHLTEAFAHAYRDLPNIIDQLKKIEIDHKLETTELNPMTSWFRYGLCIFFAGICLALIVLFALITGNVAGIGDFLVSQLMEKSYQGSPSVSQVSEFVAWFTPVMAIFGGLSMFGFVYFLGEAKKSLPFKSYDQYKANNANEIRRMELQNMSSYNSGPSNSNQFASGSSKIQRFFAGLLSGLTLGLIKWDPEYSFIFLFKWSMKGKYPDAGRQLAKSVLYMALIASAVFYFPFTFGLSLGYLALSAYIGGALLNGVFNRGSQNARVGLPVKPWKGTWNEMADWAEDNTTGFSLGIFTYGAKRALLDKKVSAFHKGLTYLSGVSAFFLLSASIPLFILGMPAALPVLITGIVAALAGTYGLTRIPGWRANLDTRQFLGYAGLIMLFVGAGLTIATGPAVWPLALFITGGLATITRLGLFKVGGIFRDNPEVRIKNLRNFIRLAILGTMLLLLVLLAPQLALIGFGIQVSAVWLFVTILMMSIGFPTINHIISRLNAPRQEESLKAQVDNGSSNQRTVSVSQRDQSLSRVISPGQMNDAKKGRLALKQSRLSVTNENMGQAAKTIKEMAGMLEEFDPTDFYTPREDMGDGDESPILGSDSFSQSLFHVPAKPTEEDSSLKKNGFPAATSKPVIALLKDGFTTAPPKDLKIEKTPDKPSGESALLVDAFEKPEEPLKKGTKKELIVRKIEDFITYRLAIIGLDRSAHPAKYPEEQELREIQRNPKLYSKIADEILLWKAVGEREPGSYWNSSAAIAALERAAKGEQIFSCEHILNATAQIKAKEAKADVKKHSAEDKAVLKLVDEMAARNELLGMKPLENTTHTTADEKDKQALCEALSKTKLFDETVKLYKDLYQVKLAICELSDPELTIEERETKLEAPINIYKQLSKKIVEKSGQIFENYQLNKLFLGGDDARNDDWTIFWAGLIFLTKDVHGEIETHPRWENEFRTPDAKGKKYYRQLEVIMDLGLLQKVEEVMVEKTKEEKTTVVVPGHMFHKAGTAGDEGDLPIVVPRPPSTASDEEEEVVGLVDASSMKTTS